MDDKSILIYENLEKGYQYRLTYSTFREVEYLHVRKYFLSYEGEWTPSKEGASIPATIPNVHALLEGLLELLALKESADAVATLVDRKLKELKNERSNDISTIRE